MDVRIDRMAETPGMLAHLVADATEGLLDAAPADGGWSARTVLAHFRDDEYLCMRPALERALAEETPEVRFIDGGDWEPARNRTRERREWLLADFALQRQATVSILRMLRPEEWQRQMRTEGREPFTVSQLVDAWIEHDASHVAQLESLIGETVAEVIERRSQMVDWRTGRKAGD
jgi:hypothetical protein